MDTKFPFDQFLNFNNSLPQENQKEFSISEIHHDSFNEADLLSFKNKKAFSENNNSNNENSDYIDSANPLNKLASLNQNSFSFNTQTSPSSLEEEELEEQNFKILAILKDLIPHQKFSAYFEDNFKLSQVTQDIVEFQVNTNFVKTMIESHYLPHIHESVKNVLGKTLQITINLQGPTEIYNLNNKDHNKGENNFILSDEYRTKSSKSNILENNLKKNKKLPPVKDARFYLDLIPSKEDLINQVNSTVLNHMEDYSNGQIIDFKKTFDSFIVGTSNNMAYASAIAVTKNPGKVYPSLYLHGNSGLGKTHLLNAVANKLRELQPQLKVILITARDFMTEMVNAMANKKVHEFRKKYSEQVDVLMIDDVHELKNKTGTQNEFFHVFNELYNKGKQLIFTSDKSPKLIDGLEERIKTRLSWGLVLDIQEPDFETRIAILKKKAMEEDIYLSVDVVNLIANSVKGNIRELEGSLIRLGAYASVMQVDIDIEIAKEQLKITDSQQKAPKLSMETIAKVISDYFKIPIADIRSKVRLRDVTKARHMAMYLSYKKLQETLTQIGIFFGKRDHTSVLHAIEKVKSQMDTDQDFRQIVLDLENRL